MLSEENFDGEFWDIDEENVRPSNALAFQRLASAEEGHIVYISSTMVNDTSI